MLDRQIAEPFSEWSRAHRDPYLFTYLVTAKTEAALPEIEKAVDSAVAALAAAEVDLERLLAIKSNRRYGLVIGLDDPEKVASTLAVWTSPTGSVDGIERFMAALAGLTADDLVTFAKERLGPSQRTVVSLVTAKKEGM